MFIEAKHQFIKIKAPTTIPPRKKEKTNGSKLYTLI